MSEANIEQQINAKGLSARRVRIEQIDQLMDGVRYETHVVPGTTTTIATAIAANGFTLATEVSACASPANFDEDIGIQIAVGRCEKAARDELWKLEGWRLKCDLESRSSV